MTDEQGEETDDDRESSPWATDQIPAATGPIVWDRPQGGDSDPVSERPDPEPPDSDVADERAGSRRWKWVALAAGVALISAVAVVSLTSGASSNESAADTTAGTDVDDLVPEPGTLPALDDDAEGTVGVDGAASTDERSGVGPTSTGPVAVPDAVAAIDQPTELVMSTSSGELLTLSLPSRTLRTTDIELGVNGASLSVSPDATLVTSYDRQSDPVLVPRSGLPIVLDQEGLTLDDGATISRLEGYGWTPDGDGSTSILAIGYADDSNASALYLIGADGTLIEDRAEFSPSNFFLFSPGVRFINDAGGVYRDRSGRLVDQSLGRVRRRSIRRSAPRSRVRCRTPV